MMMIERSLDEVVQPNPGAQFAAAAAYIRQHFIVFRTPQSCDRHHDIRILHTGPRDDPHQGVLTRSQAKTLLRQKFGVDACIDRQIHVQNHETSQVTFPIRMQIGDTIFYPSSI